MVFQDQKALADLNAITHKYVAQETARRIAAARQAGVPAVGIDAIALLESPLAAYCDRTLAITAPEELRVKRIMAREGIFRGLCPDAGGGPEAQCLVPGAL